MTRPTQHEMSAAYDTGLDHFSERFGKFKRYQLPHNVREVPRQFSNELLNSRYAQGWMTGLECLIERQRDKATRNRIKEYF